MCQAFIKNVLGVCKSHQGIFGETLAYYGTVEQQGQLTLHLHMLVYHLRRYVTESWIELQTKMVEYLEAVHQGEFFDGQLHDVNQQVKEEQKNDSEYLDPTKPCLSLHQNYAKKKNVVVVKSVPMLTAGGLNLDELLMILSCVQMAIAVECQQKIKVAMISKSAVLTSKESEKFNFQEI